MLKFKKFQKITPDLVYYITVDMHRVFEKNPEIRNLYDYLELIFSNYKDTKKLYKYDDIVLESGRKKLKRILNDTKTIKSFIFRMLYYLKRFQTYAIIKNYHKNKERLYIFYEQTDNENLEIFFSFFNTGYALVEYPNLRMLPYDVFKKIRMFLNNEGELKIKRDFNKILHGYGLLNRIKKNTIDWRLIDDKKIIKKFFDQQVILAYPIIDIDTTLKPELAKELRYFFQKYFALEKIDSQKFKTEDKIKKQFANLKNKIFKERREKGSIFTVEPLRKRKFAIKQFGMPTVIFDINNKTMEKYRIKIGSLKQFIKENNEKTFKYLRRLDDIFERTPIKEDELNYVQNYKLGKAIGYEDGYVLTEHGELILEDEYYTNIRKTVEQFLYEEDKNNGNMNEFLKTLKDFNIPITVFLTGSNNLRIRVNIPIILKYKRPDLYSNLIKKDSSLEFLFKISELKKFFSDDKLKIDYSRTGIVNKVFFYSAEQDIAGKEYPAIRIFKNYVYNEEYNDFIQNEIIKKAGLSREEKKKLSTIINIDIKDITEKFNNMTFEIDDNEIDVIIKQNKDKKDEIKSDDKPIEKHKFIAEIFYRELDRVYYNFIKTGLFYTKINEYVSPVMDFKTAKELAEGLVDELSFNYYPEDTVFRIQDDFIIDINDMTYEQRLALVEMYLYHALINYDSNRMLKVIMPAITLARKFRVSLKPIITLLLMYVDKQNIEDEIITAAKYSNPDYFEVDELFVLTVNMPKKTPYMAANEFLIKEAIKQDKNTIIIKKEQLKDIFKPLNANKIKQYLKYQKKKGVIDYKTKDNYNTIIITLKNLNLFELKKIRNGIISLPKSILNIFKTNRIKYAFIIAAIINSLLFENFNAIQNIFIE